MDNHYHLLIETTSENLSFFGMTKENFNSGNFSNFRTLGSGDENKLLRKELLKYQPQK
jgi:hypothetical protein